jgi:hypothetical protein
VLAADTKRVPFRGPKIAPAAKVRTEAGNSSTVARAYTKMYTAGSIGLSVSPDARVSRIYTW